METGQTEVVAEVQPVKTFDKWVDATNYGFELTRTHKIYLSRVAQDRFARYRPKKPFGRCLGVSLEAIKECEKIAPGGKWGVEADPIKDGYRLALWYSKYLPYANGMMLAEYGYRAFGIDYESINSYFHSCMGFVGMITNGQNPVLEDEDINLYREIYDASCEIKPPDLPFDEAFRPALCFVWAKAPKRVAKFLDYDRDHWLIQHARMVFEKLGKPQPEPKVTWKT